MRRLILALTLAILLALLGGEMAAAQTEAPPQINIALADLGARLQQSIALSNLSAWEFVQNRYMDTALGCPLVAGTPVPEGVLAYTFLLTFQGTRYDYRVSVDGSIAFPCDANLLQVTLTAPIVVATSPCPPDFAGFLPTRLTVNTQAQVAPGTLPSRVRNGPSLSADQIALAQPGTIVDVLGGPSCADSYVWYQVSVNGVVGWMAEGQAPDNYFLEPLGAAATTPVPVTAAPTVVIATPVPTLPATPIQPEVTGIPTEITAPTPLIPHLAAVSGDALTLYALGDDGTLTAVAAVAGVLADVGPGVEDITWSPNGQALAFTAMDDAFQTHLYLTDSAGNPPVLLATNVYSQMPVAFTPDSSEVIYARVAEGATPTTEGELVNFFRQGLAADAPAQLIGTVIFGVGCGGGTPYPAEQVYQWETGYGARGLVLEVTPHGIVYSTNCTGIGTALFDMATGESTELGSNLSRVDVLPDGSRIAGISDDGPANGGTLMVIDLESGTVTPLGAVATPDQIAWGPDGDLYYSVRTPTGDIIPGSDSEVLDALGMPDGVPLNTVAIHRVDLEATTDAEIYSTAGYGIGRLLAAPDNEWLYFSLIPNGEVWVNAVLNGAITPQTPASEIQALFAPSLYRLSLAGGNAELLGTDIVKATLNRAAFATEGDAVG